LKCQARWVAALLWAAVCLHESYARAQDDDDEPEYKSGLVARYRVGDVEARRLDADVAYSWGTSSPDPRLPPGKFTAQWTGRLFTIVPGEYQLHVFAAGKLKIELAGKVLMESTFERSGWGATKAVRLEYGHHPITIAFEKISDDARLAIFWEGPKFQLEPIPPRNLFHDPKETPASDYEQGQLLTRGLRCAACHAIPGQATPIAAPSLSSAGKQLDADWLVQWLAPKDPPAKTPEITRRMPHFGMSRDDAQALAAYLASEAQKVGALTIEPDPTPPKAAESEKKKNDEKPKKVKPTAQLGATLFRTVGCLACHQAEGLGAGGLFGGGDLTQIAAKRPAEFFAGWLADPSAFNASHRMPVFRLSTAERESLALYLATLGKNVEQDKPKKPSADLIDRGRKLAGEHRCAACHVMPGKPATGEVAKGVRSKLPAKPNWDASCLADADLPKHRPGYALHEEAAKPIRAYLAAQLALAGDVPAVDPQEGAFVMAERQCLSCHARDPASGIAPHLAKVVALDGELAAQLPALAPPALNGVGDKLHEQSLLWSIEATRPLRPWLRIRMPRFTLDAREKKALVDYFVAHDRIPDRPAGRSTTSSEPMMQVAGSRLVTADGFGCTSCHQVGSSMPHQVALNARGTDLSMIQNRVRRSWYDRWVRDPARIVPRMEMPSVKLPVRGVLREDLDEQLAAVWHVVNEPGFEPPLPNPIRTVRNTGLPVDTRSQVVADVFLDGKKSWIKPLVIGLPNRHNVLFDLETASLAGWWIGDTARQRTRGKSWHWEPGGTHVWPLARREPEMSIERDGKMLTPIVQGQFAANFDSIEHIPNGVAIEYRLRFTAPPDRAIHVRQVWKSVTADVGVSPISFRREIDLTGLRSKDKVLLSLAPAIPFSLARDGREIQSPAKHSGIKISLLEPRREGEELKGTDGTSEARLSFDADAQGNARCVLEYAAALPIDQYLPVNVPLIERASLPLDVVPGYDAVQWPLGEQVMPTGLAWMVDGTLAVSSLKGEVWLAKDRDGDKAPETWRLFSDNLSTPYGLAIPPGTTGTIDVITKSALVRLTDHNRDDLVDRCQVLASGWGHTDDYHDWAVGLIRNAAGDYYVALPCEQDNRSEAAAHLRGKLLRIAPPEESRQGARWEIEEVCGGLRFPMGLALNRQQEIFASDNQGNFNPFNELNHLLPGKRYGFINSLEKKQKLEPRLEEPAINIPHPWTRSVNGICFLETPADLRKRDGDLFGPFEGHLIGCEYDTQRLVRMSLQKIGETYQGAAYPFSRDAAKGKRGLEGPVVCAISPSGDVIVGNMRDSGWGAGANVGSMVRIRPQAKLPAGIAEVRATANGLSVAFTTEVDAKGAADASHYAVDAYRRVSTPAYGGADVDRHAVKVTAVHVDSSRKQVELVLESFREGFVYELRVKNLAADQAEFFPAEAYFTLRKKPAE